MKILPCPLHQLPAPLGVLEGLNGLMLSNKKFDQWNSQGIQSGLRDFG